MVSLGVMGKIGSYGRTHFVEDFMEFFFFQMDIGLGLCTLNNNQSV